MTDAIGFGGPPAGEVVRGEVVRADAVRADAVRADAVRADAVRADPAPDGAVRADAVRADAVRADPAPDGAAPDGAAPHGGGPTGQPRVDAALAQLDRIAALPPAQQVAGYAEVHRELQAALAALDEER